MHPEKVILTYLKVHEVNFFKDTFLACTETAYGAAVPVTNLGDYNGCLSIASPGYPTMYNDNSDCHWSLQASDPNNVIQIEVVDWKVSFEIYFKFKSYFANVFFSFGQFK